MFSSRKLQRDNKRPELKNHHKISTPRNRVKLRYFKLYSPITKIKQDGNLYIIIIMVYVNVGEGDSFNYTKEDQLDTKENIYLSFLIIAHYILQSFHCVKMSVFGVILVRIYSKCWKTRTRNRFWTLFTQSLLSIQLF